MKTIASISIVSWFCLATLSLFIIIAVSISVSYRSKEESMLRLQKNEAATFDNIGYSEPTPVTSYDIFEQSDLKQKISEGWVPVSLENGKVLMSKTILSYEGNSTRIIIDDYPKDK